MRKQLTKLLTILCVVFSIGSDLSAQAVSAPQVSCGSYQSFVVRQDGTLWTWGEASGSATQVAGLANVKACAGSAWYGVAVKNDGTVSEWVSDSSGQSGLPVPVTILANVVAVAAGDYHSVALKSDGTVWTWGENSSGQLGTGMPSNSSPVQVSIGKTIAVIAAAGNTSYAIANDGTAWAWGENSHGQLGDGTQISQQYPVQMIANASFVKVAASPYHSILIASDSSAWTCGGVGGELGYTSSPTTTLAKIPGFTNVVQASGGYGFTLLRTSNGKVYTCGYSGYGTNGDLNNQQSDTPRELMGLTNVAAIASGYAHSIALTTSGTIFAWGDNSGGRLGTDGFDIATPMPIKLTDGVKQFAAHLERNAVVTDTGDVLSWGSNPRGQLGNGTLIASDLPTSAGLDDVVQISLSAGHTLALKNDGTVWAWGDNGSGQLGDGTFAQRALPDLVPGFVNVKKVIAGDAWSLALKQDGTLWQTNGSDVPTQVPGNGLWLDLAQGFSSDFTVAIKHDGTVWAWGNNYFGQLGDGSYAPSSIPVQVLGLTDIVKIDAFSGYAMATKSDGTVWAWGDNSYGQLGNGSMASSPIPVQALGITTAIDSSVSYIHSLTATRDGRVYVWGFGLGTPWRWDIRSSPQMIEKLRGVVGVKAWGVPDNSSYSIALKEDGSYEFWGATHFGEVGRWLYRAKPEKVLGVNALYGTPTVAVTSTTSQQQIALGQTVAITATLNLAGAPTGSLALYHNGKRLASDSTPPYTVSFSPPTWGTYELNVRAENSNGVSSLPSETLLVEVPYDSDSDDLPDWWEIKHLGGINGSALGNADYDGYSNLQEYRNKTNPHGFDEGGGYDFDEDGATDPEEVLAGTQLSWRDHPAVELIASPIALP